jgi:hypothetical protein
MNEATTSGSTSRSIQKERTFMRLAYSTIVTALVLAMSSGIAYAQTGPVAKSCKSDIAKLCSGKSHDGEVRICLESNYEKVSPACQKALDTTGGGRGRFLFGKGK